MPKEIGEDRNESYDLLPDISQFANARLPPRQPQDEMYARQMGQS